MNTTRKFFKWGLGPVLMAFIITTIIPGLPTEARAKEGAAFLGGMVAGHIVGGAVRRSKIRTAAAVQAANQPKTQTVYVQQPATTTAAHTATAAKSSTEDRLKELDKLAAGAISHRRNIRPKRRQFWIVYDGKPDTIDSSSQSSKDSRRRIKGFSSKVSASFIVRISVIWIY